MAKYTTQYKLQRYAANAKVESNCNSISFQVPAAATASCKVTVSGESQTLFPGDPPLTLDNHPDVQILQEFTINFSAGTKDLVVIRQYITPVKQ